MDRRVGREERKKRLVIDAPLDGLLSRRGEEKTCERRNVCGAPRDLFPGGKKYTTLDHVSNTIRRQRNLFATRLTMIDLLRSKRWKTGSASLSYRERNFHFKSLLDS